MLTTFTNKVKCKRTKTYLSMIGPETCPVIMLPKCASRSMLASLGSEESKSKAIPTAFIREPLERLRSVFKYFNQSDYNYPWPSRYEGFVDWVLADGYNAHTLSQAKHLAWHGIVDLFLFEDLSKVWNEKKLPPLPMLNPSKPEQLNSDYRADELRLLYADDLEARSWLI